MNLAITLRNQMSGSFNEGVRCCDQEKVGTEDLLGFREFFLGFFEIKIDVESFDEIGYGVVVLVVLLLDNADDVLELLLILARVACAAAIRDDCRCQISQDPRAGSLNRINKRSGKEQLADGIACGFIVEEGEERPVDEPSSVGKLCERVVEEFGVDGFLYFLNFLHGGLPVRGEDFGGELSPCCGGNFVVVGGEDAELVKEVAGGLVVAATVLEVAEVVEDVDHFDCDLYFISECPPSSRNLNLHHAPSSSTPSWQPYHSSNL